MSIFVEVFWLPKGWLGLHFDCVSILGERVVVGYVEVTLERSVDSDDNEAGILVKSSMKIGS
jgi:hypothetical protein